MRMRLSKTWEGVKQGFTPRQGLGLVLGLLLVTDAAILLNVPVLRPVLSLATYTILPGWLLLTAWRQDGLGLAERLILSIAISLAAMMVMGVGMSVGYPALGYSAPLSTPSVVSTFTALMVVLAILTFFVNRRAFAFTPPRWGLNPWEKLLLLVPLAFPFLSIVGTRRMDDTGSNLVLVVLVLAIAGYALLASMVSRWAPRAPYAIILFLIGVATIFMWSLRTQFVLGQDSVQEVWAFQHTARNARLDFSTPQLILSVVSMTALPAIWHSLSGVGEYLFKVVFPLVFSLMPPMVFLIGRRYMPQAYAFIGAMFLAAQSRFFTIVELRSEVATFFLAAALLAMFHRRLGALPRRACVLLFLTGVVLSHYSSAYALIAVVVGAWFLTRIVHRQESPSLPLTGPLVAFYSVVALVWYGQIFAIPFESGVSLAERSVRSLANFYQLDTRADVTQQALFLDPSVGLLRQLNIIVYEISILFIFVGLVAAVGQHFRKPRLTEGAPSKPDYDWEFLALGIVGFLLLVVGVVVPEFFKTYDVQRFSMLLMIMLSPLFVTGGLRLSRFLRAQAGVLPLGLVAVYFLFTTGLAYHAFGISHQIILNTTGYGPNRFLVREQEDRALDWLQGNYNPTLPVYADHVGIEERWAWRTDPPGSLSDRYKLQPEMELSSGYIFLRYPNIRGGLFNVKGVEIPSSQFAPLLEKKDKIYANSGSEIYMAQKQP